jgi:hypothetical protein
MHHGPVGHLIKKKKNPYFGCPPMAEYLHI